MTSWHRNRRGRGCTTPRCRSQNIANSTFSEGWLQKSKEFAGLPTAPATHHAKNTANTTFSCGMLQNAGFGTIPCGGGGGWWKNMVYFAVGLCTSSGSRSRSEDFRFFNLLNFFNYWPLPGPDLETSVFLIFWIFLIQSIKKMKN